MNPKVDAYFTDGCGRCSLYQTPECKVHSYTEPMEHLRGMLLETELTEEYKWKQPCYTLDDKNVLILTAFKDYCCLSFFKGSLMKDPEEVMAAPGENSQAARQLRYATTSEVKAQEGLIRQYIQEAIALEKAGAKVDFRQKEALAFPEELIRELESDSAFRKAFEALTPGRQRSWNLHFTSAKQSTTRTSRIEKAKAKVLEGKGWNER